MPDCPSFSITIRRCYLMSSTIIGIARVVIDNKILLKEIPIFHNEDQIMVQLSATQVAVCPADMDLVMINQMVWIFRELIEQVIVEEFKKQRNGTLS